MSLRHDNMKLLHYIEEKPCFSVDQSTKRRNILSRQGQGGGELRRETWEAGEGGGEEKETGW